MLESNDKVWLLIESSQSPGFCGRTQLRGLLITSSEQMAEVVLSNEADALVMSKQLSVSRVMEIAKKSKFDAIHLLKSWGEIESYASETLARLY